MRNTERYTETITEFERRRQEGANPESQIPVPPKNTLWKRLFGGRSPTFVPISPSPEEQLAALEARFSSWLYSDRQMVVCHLKATNPERQEGIITGYLQSPELLKDAQTIGEFFSFWFLEFFQRVDTGPIENLPSFIKTKNSASLPHELQKAKKEIFDPLFKLLNGKEEEIFSKVRSFGVAGVARLLGEEVINSERQLPDSLKSQYKNYVGQLVKLEVGIIPLKPAETRVEPSQKTSPRSTSRLLTVPQPEFSPSPEEHMEYSYSIVLGSNTEPIPVKNSEELQERMKKIRGLSQEITAEMVWKHLIQLSKMTPIQIGERYNERVAGGPFEGWHEIRMGRKWLIIFSIKDSNVSFRVGPHENVYATGRRKPKDRARSL